METANLVTYTELFQLLAIFSGVWVAILSLAGTLAIAWYVRDSNRRDKDNEHRHREAEANNERRHREAEANNERRHQELLKAISPLYRHVHADGSPAIVPLADLDPAYDAEPALPSAADN